MIDTLVRARHFGSLSCAQGLQHSCAHLPCHPPRFTCHLVLARGQKYEDGSRLCERLMCKVCHIAPIAHATSMRVRVLRTLREYTSVCFHETLRMQCSHLNISLCFISPPMWENMSLYHYFSIQCFKQQTLSIDISLILAPLWTRFNSL
ncbi:hypothetical protein Hanom_Chr16g01430981 [Helianthus anomalus]